jgi:pyridinium-3,5-biscarboxylic acid mononucleotide sulfurtransferase
MVLHAHPAKADPTGPLEAKRRRAIDFLRPYGSVVVALSGGVDSAALLAVAVDALGAANVLAVTGVSDAVIAEDVEDAKSVAMRLGVAHEVVLTREMERPGYRANFGDRCFHCRSELFELLRDLAHRRGFAATAYGAIVDDLGDDRPGMEAARRLGVLSPFIEADIGKDDVRALAKIAGLPVNEKPASPCLASRIPVGVTVTPERLAAVSRAESGLRALGFRIVRVRHRGEAARVELGAHELSRLANASLRDRVTAAVRDAGFRHVTIDPRGYVAPRQRPGAAPKIHRIGPKRSTGQ